MKELSALNHYLWRYRWRLIIGILFVTVSNVFGVFPAQVVRHSIDLVKENIFLYQLSGGLELRDMVYAHFGEILVIFAAIVILFALLRGFFMFMMRQTIIVMSRFIEYDLKNDIYGHFQSLSTSFYRRHNTGDLMARITEDVGKVRLYVGPAIMYSINLASLILLVVGIMLTVNVRLTVFVLLPLPVLAATIYFINRIIQRKSIIIQKQLARLTTFSQEMFSGIKVVKSFASEKGIYKHFDRECESYRQKSMNLVRVNAVFFPLILLLIGLSTLLTLFVGGKEVMAGNLTAGNLAEFFMYVNMLAWPFASIGWVTSIVQRAAASQRRINELMNIKPEITSRENIPVEINGNLRFENVDFIYRHTGVQALDNVSFEVKEGETLGIIGKTGSGKSTVANLLFRLFDVNSGRISFEDIDVRKLDPGYFRKQIGYVPQDDYLFSDSIANNILFGYHKDQASSLDGSKDKMLSLLRKVTTITDVKKDILQFPKGFETRLGERGVTLSGGQKQRVAIARAIIGDPEVLILDDCFSAIDTHTEARILRQLSEYLNRKTAIIISHRVSSVKNASRIIVLDKGRVIEQGSHQDLLDQKGYYYELYEKQMLEKELYREA